MKKIYIYILFILGLFLLGMDPVDASGNCVNKIGSTWCPCTTVSYDGTDPSDPTLYLTEVTYKDANTGLDKTVSLEDWLNDSNVGDGDRAKGLFYYTEESQFAMRTGESRVEATTIVRASSNWRTNLEKQRGFVCRSQTIRESIPVTTQNKSKEEILNGFQNYTCNLFEETELYQNFLRPAYIAIKIAAPCVVIALGTFDLVSASIADNADKMKKAQSKLVKRIIIGICLFMLPTVINALFKLVGVATSTCGIR